MNIQVDFCNIRSNDDLILQKYDDHEVKVKMQSLLTVLAHFTLVKSNRIG